MATIGRRALLDLISFAQSRVAPVEYFRSANGTPAMKNNSSRERTEIAFILDRSGSMESCRDATIDGFNQFLREQQQAKGTARLTLVLFDDKYLVPTQSIRVQDVSPLNRDSYTTDGATALLDAIGRTINELGARLAALLEPERPDQVIISILTDGLENASRRYGWADIASKIEHQTRTYSWTFLFLGANQDAIATAARMNITAANAATYTPGEVGSRASVKAFSRRLVALRHSKIGVASAGELDDITKPLSVIVEEEDQKQRHAGRSD